MKHIRVILLAFGAFCFSFVFGAHPVSADCVPLISNTCLEMISPTPAAQVTPRFIGCTVGPVASYNYCCTTQQECDLIAIQTATPIQGISCNVSIEETLFPGNPTQFHIDVSGFFPGNVNGLYLVGNHGESRLLTGPGVFTYPNSFSENDLVQFRVQNESSWSSSATVHCQTLMMLVENPEQELNPLDPNQPTLVPWPTFPPNVTPTSIIPQPTQGYTPPVNSLFLYRVNPLTVTGNTNPLLGFLQGFLNLYNFGTPAGFLNELLPFLFSLAGMILFVMLVWGGFEMMRGAADTKAQEAGKNRITAALIGFGLLFISYWIAQIVQYIFGVNVLG